jgi:hypothetical protein
MGHGRFGSVGDTALDRVVQRCMRLLYRIEKNNLSPIKDGFELRHESLIYRESLFVFHFAIVAYSKPCNCPYKAWIYNAKLFF